MAYLSRAHTDWLFQDDPGDALIQRWCSQRPFISPEIERGRQQVLGVKARKCGLLTLRKKDKNRVRIYELRTNKE